MQELQISRPSLSQGNPLPATTILLENGQERPVLQLTEWERHEKPASAPPGTLTKA